MNPEDKQHWLDRYGERLDQWGVSPEALGWGGGRERQAMRFKSSLDFQLFTQKPITSILDVGCGFGDLGVWLAKNYPSISYVGIDINPDLIAKGRDRYKLDLSIRDMYEFESNSFDLVISNGVFNYRMKNENHEEYVEKCLTQFISLARVGISVDFMSTYVDFTHENAFHCTEQFAINIIKQFTRRYTIRNDYLDFEFMLYAYL